ncbi:hypothetical protein DFH08DRAFT_1029252 [Mycena albidolilacea]|uniref:Uncharacterized protein n=1 Tax=Mycena albidolilacea TaxID=1033008 RepID=A0AAD6ZI19_9AGAR|nr:hypothetical protein DFH08DRAFT_1029252 [Mycena albidolilacea]
MPKHTDIAKCSLKNYWGWKGEAEAFMLAKDLMGTVDPNIPVPTGVIQFCQWTEEHQGLWPSDVKTKIDNVNVQRSGRLLWAQLAAFFMTPDAANHSMLMARFNEITHNLQQPVNQFLQAIVAVEHNLTSIAVSLPPFMVRNKILGGMLAAYALITTVLQSELAHDIPDMITAINNWESLDRQKADSAFCAACLAACPTASLPVPNHGGDYSVDPTVFAVCTQLRRSQNSHLAPSPAFDWTNTKNRTNYCISKMPDNVHRHIICDRDHRTSLAHDDGAEADNKSDHEHYASVTFGGPGHFAATVTDLLTEPNPNTMDSETLEGFLATTDAFEVPANPIKQCVALLAHVMSCNQANVMSVDRPSTPIVVSAVSTPSSTPSKGKKKKKKKKSSTTAVMELQSPTSQIQNAMHQLTLSKQEVEFSV